MAKAKGTSRTTKKKRSSAGRGGKRSAASPRAVNAEGKHLVIVESPTKAKTINKYLGGDYVVMASVGHVRDLPSRSPKGVKQEVPGVDIEHDFEPTYEVLPDKKKTVGDLRKAAKQASDVWFATDLDREGEAIAWHLAQALGVDSRNAKRVVFNAITKDEITHAFSQPRHIDQAKVDAQQARRILDRLVGYQVSPLLWKKVAGGLSAGRVQSVATRLVVEREREIEAFIPDEYWKVITTFATELDKADALTCVWLDWLADVAEGKERTVREKLTWLSEHKCLQAELIELDGQAFKPDNRDAALAAVQRLGFALDDTQAWEDDKAKGPARRRVNYRGHVHEPSEYRIKSIQTKRTTTKPSAPFITSSLQQAAANQLGFTLQRTMRIAQQLYEGIDIHGAEGQTGLITYMRTDSTHLSKQAIDMARGYIASEWGQGYLPDKPQVYTSSNKMAQEAHEAIRPTDVQITPKRVRKDLTEEQYKLYRLVWERFLGSQMKPAQWDSTTILTEARSYEGTAARSDGFATLKATGRKLVYDGFYKAVGIPSGGDLILPSLQENQQVAPLQIDPRQQFTAPPPRYSEASLQKKLEEEGIGRPSTYAPIIQTIQDRKYVGQVGPKDRRLFATDLGKVVTDKLTEAFPTIMEVGYTRQMEEELDKVEDEHHDWVQMLRAFYGPFKDNLDHAHEVMTHAKAETQPAPFECQKCGAPTVYRFGKNGRFLSCSRYPDCDYAAPIDREGRPIGEQFTDIACPICGGRMTKRTGRFGPFLGCENYPACKGILNLDPKKGTVKLPKPPPLQTDVPCPKCGEGVMNLRMSKRGPWMSCNRFPRCRGRVAWSALDGDKQKELEKALTRHEAEHPVPQVRTLDGRPIGDDYVPLVTETDAPETIDAAANADAPATIDSDAA
jgi:DNA topoisomerase I